MFAKSTMNTLSRLVVASAFLGVSAAANAGIVDLFTTAQAELSDNTVNATFVESTAGVGDPTILGGNRDLGVSLLSNGGVDGRSAEIGVGGGVLDFSVDTSSTAHGVVEWDGAADGTVNTDFTGLGGIDLTSGGTLSAFNVQTIFADAGFEFVVTAWTDANNWTAISFAATGTAVPTSTLIPFSAFTNVALCGSVNPAPGVNSITCGGGGGNQPVDLMNLGALRLDLDPSGGTTSIDLTLDSITTVPEPSPLALIGIGLIAGGLIAFRRRAVR